MYKIVWAFVALVGTLAITTAAGGSTSSKITGAQIKDYSITSIDLANHTIRAHDLAPALIAMLKGQTGATGPAGPKGDTGATGAKGATGAAGKNGTNGTNGAKGDKGDTGATGAGVKIAGVVETIADLPVDATVGDAYLVVKDPAADPTHAYVWDGKAWADAGPIVGPQGVKGDKGDKGDQGVQGETGPQGPPGIKDLTADGPYPSLTQLKDYDAGENSTAAWAGDGTLQQSWVQCAADKVAFGGGFGLDDVQSDALTVVTSAPAYIKGGVVYPADTPTVGPQNSIVPNGWLVQGYNKSGHDLIVRPWVICATIVK
jgi:Collagen triple helix repeat (20 copies)